MIINLTQHSASQEQLNAGVTEPGNKEEVKDLLTFTSPPSREEIQERAKRLARIAVASGVHEAMIGGAPYMMGALEGALIEVGIAPVYAFSRRESVEKVMPDGSVKKVTTFRHAGWVRP